MIIWLARSEMPCLCQVLWFQLAKLEVEGDCAPRTAEGNRLGENQGEVWQQYF